MLDARAQALILGTAIAIAQPALAETDSVDPTVAEADAPQADPAPQDGGGVQAIVVTAQKRAQNVQDIPIAITALGADDLAASQINSVEGVLGATPNVQFSRTAGNARISIRGLGYDNVNVGGEARVAYHQDGVYMSRPTSALGTFFDVSRVEVLRGPQGTLYGRNSTAGAINVITAEPTDKLSGYGALTVGNYDLIQGKGAISGQLSDGVSGRLAFDIIRRGGFGRNNVNGLEVDDENTRAVRGKLKFEPTDSLRVLVSADYLTEDDHAFGLHYLGGGGRTAAGVPVVPLAERLGARPSSNPRDIDINYGPFANRELYGGSVEATLDVGEFTVTSLTALRRSRYGTTSDLSGLPGGLTRYIQSERSRTFSEELRASRSWDLLDLTLGAFYFNETVNGSIQVPQRGISVGRPDNDVLLAWYWVGGALKTRAGAVFGQADVHLTDQLTLSIGGRYSSERKSIDEYFQLDNTRAYVPGDPVRPSRTNKDSETWSSFDPRFVLQYQPTRDLLFYASYSRAFKSGGYNLGGLQPAFAPEKLKAYEVGAKAELFDRLLRANVAAFRYDYSDLQASVIVGTAVIVLNAADARVEGVEAELELAPVQGLLLRASGAYLDSKYRSFSTADASRPDLGIQNLAGNRLTQAPRYTLNLLAEYKWELPNGDLRIRGEANATDKVYFSPFNREDLASRPYTLFNASMGYADDAGWSVNLFGRNLTNETYVLAAAVSTVTLGYPMNGAYGPPRTYGVEFRFDF